jgi:hypothetical protein
MLQTHRLYKNVSHNSQSQGRKVNPGHPAMKENSCSLVHEIRSVRKVSAVNELNRIVTNIQQDATLHSLFYLETALHVRISSRKQTTVSTASGICHTVTTICRYRRRVGIGLSVLWVAY